MWMVYLGHNKPLVDMFQVTVSGLPQTKPLIC